MLMQSHRFSSPQHGRHFQNSCNTLAAVYNDILRLCCSKFYIWSLLWSHTQVHVHGPWSGWADLYKTIWAWAGLHSGKVCTNLSVHGISVINTRWSLTTEIVKSSFTVHGKVKVMDWWSFITFLILRINPKLFISKKHMGGFEFALNWNIKYSLPLELILEVSGTVVEVNVPRPFVGKELLAG